VPKRISYFDVLRGVAIIGVVAIHSNGQGLNFASDSFNFNFSLLWRQAINFSVPLFLSISGYFIVKKSIKSSKEYAVFLKKQIPKVYIPCIFWSLIGFLLAVFLFGRSSLYEFFNLITFQTFGPYYFIALIIQYYIFLPVLIKFSNMKGFIITIIISLSTTILIFYIRYYTTIALPLIIYAGLFPTWIVFFVYGLYLGLEGNIPISNKWLIFAILISYAFSCVESYYLYSQFNQAGDAVTAVKPTSFIYSLFMISFLFKNVDLINMTFLKYLGEISFGIYLLHIIILRIASKVLNSVSFIFNTQLLYQFGLVFFTLLISCVIIVTTKMILNKKTLKIIGF